ncbi:ATP-binding protein [Kiritimatiella glycovorans]|uniref:histidine kinase n=1 Tax=Kiritimatiella glycovorans TaxID=1307763 RepID=A0A0G3EFJ4_9BACT|nr:ATP-binding protein [Kiritimatiella glycovorans]AKJ63570.1 Alkaline phosphatase synthesis sensor protein PhoR [Kiritimatiella glycovorans]
MSRRKLFWKLVPSYWLVLLCSLLVLTGYTYYSAQSVYFRELKTTLEARAEAVAERARTELIRDEREALDALCRTTAELLSARITVVDSEGRLVASSTGGMPSGEGLSARPELREALQGKRGAQTRYDHRQGRNLFFVAVPVANPNGEVIGAVRVARPVTDIRNTLDTMAGRILLAGLAVGVVAMVVGVVMARRISRPLEAMRLAAERYARGDFERKVPVPEIEEIGQLAQSMNWMAERLNENLNTIRQQQHELESVLSNMAEGVIAIDRNESIIKMNRAAGEMLRVHPGEARGRSVQEAIRYANLQDFISEMFASVMPREGDMTVYGERDRHFHVYGVRLLSNEHNVPDAGVLVVLHDVTRLRLLEQIRRDFVANVSHELKTPVTSIKGFVEMLSDSGAGDHGEQKRFLDIIARQARRLEAIITDLLTLSQVDDASERGELSFESCRILPLLEDARHLCETRARDRRMKIVIDCPHDFSAVANPHLIEQAVVNLLDNAVKYSEPGGQVRVRAAQHSGEARIEVSDQGQGIDRHHLDRLFERFYRVDKNRSRKMGGTGLGLAIVKHIMQVHEGHVEVESSPGEGSTFRLRFPLQSREGGDAAVN